MSFNFAKLIKVQTQLKAPKNQKNSFGGYQYRSAEDILEAAKPVLAENDLLMHISDKVEVIGDRYYVKAVVTIIDPDNGESIAVSAYAREASTKKGMDDSQITGATSSYARKYALNAMFLIDDTKDADTDAYQKRTKKAFKDDYSKVKTALENPINADHFKAAREEMILLLEETKKYQPDDFEQFKSDLTAAGLKGKAKLEENNDK